MSEDKNEKTETRDVVVDDDLLEELVERVSSRLGNGRGRSRVQSNNNSGDLESQIAKAVNEATSKRDREREEQEHRNAIDGRLKKLEENSERTPVELRKITRFMWGSE